MNLQELLEMLQIDEPIEFEYFENFSDVIETDEDIPVNTLFLLFSDVNKDAVSEIIENYFEEILETLPDDSNDMYVLIDNIKLSLLGLLHGSDDENTMLHFAEELSRFKNWYSLEHKVLCTDIDEGTETFTSLRDALTLVRIESLESEKHRYNFDECLTYEIEDYIMDFVDLAKNNYETESEDLLDNGYVYDDEMKV